MKRAIPILCLVFLLSVVLIFSLPTIIIFAAKQQLKHIFVDSKVTISACRLNPFSSLVFADIEIVRLPVYDFKIKQAGIYYHPLALLKGRIAKFSLEDAKISLEMPGQSLAALKNYLKLNARSAFLLNCAEFSRLELNLKTQELILQAQLSSRVNLSQQSLDYLDLKIDHLDSGQLNLSNALLNVDSAAPAGALRIDKIQLSKLRLEKIQGASKLKEKVLTLHSLSAEFLGGNTNGQIEISWDKRLEYAARIQFINIDLEKLVQDLELKEKIQLSGTLGGSLTLKGAGAAINILSGDFKASETGGVLAISDTGYLENIARSSNQSLDILLESFKNYRYNTGIAKLSLHQGDLVLDAALEGQAGKRNLTVTLHDFKLIREGL